MNYQALFVEHVALLDRVVAFIARRHHLSSAEADELRSIVRLKCIEKNYDVLRRFNRQSSLRTYLTVVVERQFLDYRVSQWGRWRPSAQARRLGPVAIQLESLMMKEGLSFDEACEMLRTNHQVTTSRQELYETCCQLPNRYRRAFVGEDALASMATELLDPESEALKAEQSDATEKLCTALRRSLTKLAPQDRLILRMHFQDELTVAEIARLLRLEAKPLYRRIDALERRLKAYLEEDGLQLRQLRGFPGEARVKRNSAEASSRGAVKMWPRDVYTVKSPRRIGK